MTPYISFFCVDLLGEWPGVRTCEERAQDIPIGKLLLVIPLGVLLSLVMYGLLY
jgi:hypothetical protein